MGILSIDFDSAGLVGVEPRIVRMKTNDSLATVKTAGYVNGSQMQGNTFKVSDVVFVNYGSDSSSFEIFRPTIASNGQVTLSLEEAIGGNVIAGDNGDAGYFRSYPSGANKGYLQIFATNNTGNTATTITNAAMGQASALNIPDPGAATASFVLTESAGTQTIATGNITLTAGDLTLTAGNITVTAGDIDATAGNITAVDGNIVAGSDANQGFVTAYPPTTASGTLNLSCADNGGAYSVVIGNRSHGQSTNHYIPDPGGAASEFLIAPFTGVVVQGQYQTFTVTVDQADLATGGIKALVTAANGSASYQVTEIKMNGGGTSFSGGGGDRTITITDGAKDYTVMPTGAIQSIGNYRWGSSEVPAPATGDWYTASTAGGDIYATYSGGTTDYSTGSMDITIEVFRIA